MVSMIQIIAENSEVILMVLSIVFAIIARYFQTQATAIKEALQAVTDLSQTTLDAVRDGVISKEELDAVLAKIEMAQREIREVIDIFIPPATPTEKLSAVVFGYKRMQINFIKSRIQTEVQTMKMKSRK